MHSAEKHPSKIKKKLKMFSSDKDEDLQTAIAIG